MLRGGHFSLYISGAASSCVIICPIIVLVKFLVKSFAYFVLGLCIFLLLIMEILNVFWIQGHPQVNGPQMLPPSLKFVFFVSCVIQ